MDSSEEAIRSQADKLVGGRPEPGDRSEFTVECRVQVSALHADDARDAVERVLIDGVEAFRSKPLWDARITDYRVEEVT